MIPEDKLAENLLKLKSGMPLLMLCDIIKQKTQLDLPKFVVLQDGNIVLIVYLFNICNCRTQMLSNLTHVQPEIQGVYNEMS
jgi:hypothetical protein